MSDKVVSLNGEPAKVVKLGIPNTGLSYPVEQVWEKASEAGLGSVIVIGWDGNDLHFDYSDGNAAEVLYLLELAKHRLIKVASGEEVNSRKNAMRAILGNG